MIYQTILINKIIFNLTLNCNGATLIGSGSGNGIYFYNDHNNKVLNCNIKNYDKGIYFYSNYNNPTTPWPHNNLIQNNTFLNNNYGIKNYKGYNNTIVNNNFIDNNINSIYLTSDIFNTIIGSNNIYDKPIYYAKTSGTRYFSDEGENNYFNGIIGPTSSCLVPTNGMVINSDTLLCEGEYNLPFGLNMDFNSTLNCNGATLIGSGSGNGIYFYNDHN
ncbi:MAG: right-handed parallel beta-helix repeat-containing protein, partial [Nanoarchaeales archaeon]|nr:right-handed parallel beta-helix repeat-containing protein [Nanoarchaeales archaeon]